MAKYVFEGPKDARHNTERIALADGRTVGVGEEIDLSAEEAEMLGETLNLRKEGESQSSGSDEDSDAYGAGTLSRETS